MTYQVRNPHDLRGRVFMIKVRAMHKVSLVLIKSDYLHFVYRLFYEGTKGEAKVFLWPVTEIHPVQVPLRLMSVDLLSFTSNACVLG
jgi:hypothetical protein